MKRGSLVRVVWAMGSLLSVAATAAPRDASACLSAVYLTPSRPGREQQPRRPTVDPALLVLQAEQSLSDGEFARAAAQAVQAFPALKIVKPGSVPLADRALRVLALASVRADGGIDAGSFKGKTAAERAANLAWSVDVLRGLSAARANHPSYQTDLGEALARVPTGHAEAARVLGELADKDLLTSAEGYAALARLRAEGGDQAGRDAFVKRCETMTRTPAICATPAAGARTGAAGQT